MYIHTNVHLHVQIFCVYLSRIFFPQRQNPSSAGIYVFVAAESKQKKTLTSFICFIFFLLKLSRLSLRHEIAVTSGEINASQAVFTNKVVCHKQQPPPANGDQADGQTYCYYLLNEKKTYIK